MSKQQEETALDYPAATTLNQLPSASSGVHLSAGGGEAVRQDRAREQNCKQKMKNDCKHFTVQLEQLEQFCNYRSDIFKTDVTLSQNVKTNKQTKRKNRIVSLYL